MSVFNFFKRPPHQKFDYKPRFYDPVKEEREARLAKYKEGGGDAEQVKARISAGFRSRSRTGSIRNDSKRANLRLVAILIVLIWMTYYFLDKYLPVIVDAVE